MIEISNVNLGTFLCKIPAGNLEIVSINVLIISILCVLVIHNPVALHQENAYLHFYTARLSKENLTCLLWC